MNDKDNIIKGYYALIELGVSPLDIYLYSQVLNSDEGFALDDKEILDKVLEIKNSIDRDYSGAFTIEGHIEKVLMGDFIDYTDEEEMY